MAIATLDNLLAALLPAEDIFKDATTGEASGEFFSTLYTTGQPGAGAVPSPGINGEVLITYAGQIPFPAPVANKFVYLAGIDMCNDTGVGSGMLWDRLWHNSGIVVTTTGAQAITSPAWPARDQNGSTNGVGVGVAIEVSTVTGNGAPITNTTMAYTNSNGVAGRTGTISAFPATAVAGTLVRFSLQAGDVGVRSIQSITLGMSYVSGVIHLVAFRRNSPGVPRPQPSVAVRLGPAECGMPRWYDQSVPWIVYQIQNTTIDETTFTVQWAQG